MLLRQRPRQETQNDLCCDRSILSRAIETSTNNSTTEKLIEKPINGYASRAGHTRDDLVWDEGLASAVLKNRQKQDDGPAFQLRDFRKELLEGSERYVIDTLSV